MTSASTINMTSFSASLRNIAKAAKTTSSPTFMSTRNKTIQQAHLQTIYIKRLASSSTDT